MNLNKFLKNNPNSRKIFGERELKIIEKQLLGINLTQSEKNRLSRDIRKKLEFIQEAAQFSKEFKLKKGKTVKDALTDALEIIRQDKFFPRIKKIILYGSTVENTRTFRSDIDLAVVFPEITAQEAFEFRSRIQGRVSNLCDIQVYNVLPQKVMKEIDQKGKTLYEPKN